MTQPAKQEGRRTRPFADFLADHNQGAAHLAAGEALQRLVGAVVETGKKGTVTVTVTVEPMKGTANTLVTSVDVKDKLPVPALKTAIFFADDDDNLVRTDPAQQVFEGMRDVSEPVAPKAEALREVGS